jgi:hypothetical protein
VRARPLRDRRAVQAHMLATTYAHAKLQALHPI